MNMDFVGWGQVYGNECHTIGFAQDNSKGCSKLRCGCNSDFSDQITTNFFVTEYRSHPPLLLVLNVAGTIL